MSDSIITVEGLGKKYRLGAGRSNERYTALRDVISERRSHSFAATEKALNRLPSAEEFWTLNNTASG